MHTGLDGGPAPIRVVLADDHALLRDGVAGLIANMPAVTVVGEAENGAQAIEMYRHLVPDILLLDLQMPVMGGLEVIETLLRDFPDARIIVLTTYHGDVQAMRAMRAGARGYLLKSGLRRELGEAIRQVHAGRRVIQPEIAAAMAVGAINDALSPRECQVLKLAASGNANRQIAHLLGVTEETVKTHMRSILSKLDAKDRTHAVTIALRRGIIEL
ncbi:DNA-binding response regulator [Sphingomonas pokkalii]|uniref:DNA-binding response regulator n=1 Tax=Sphingomonas pokkalii TaxID=2175090 RepID=A0A2U0SBX8_9SPHN|nr:DNA-binding response regulator [Sphingomonas pokkalii]